METIKVSKIKSYRLFGKLIHFIENDKGELRLLFPKKRLYPLGRKRNRVLSTTIQKYIVYFSLNNTDKLVN